MKKLTTKDERAFIDALCDLTTHMVAPQKLIYAKRSGNHLIPYGEIRFMATAGGSQFGIAEIIFTNQRAGGRYSHDVETIYIHAIDIERQNPAAEWHYVPDCEHTFNTVY